jgi:hypothetical protein
VSEVNAVPPIYDQEQDSLAIVSFAQRFFDEIMQYKDQINGIWENITNVNSDGKHYNELVENYCSLANIFSNKLKSQLPSLILASEHAGVFIAIHFATIRTTFKEISEAQKKLHKCLALYYNTAKMINIIANDLGISEEKFLETANNGGDFKAVAAPGVLWSIDEFKDKEKQICEENLRIDRQYYDALASRIGRTYVDSTSCLLEDYEKQREASVVNDRLVSGLGKMSSATGLICSFPVSQYLLGRFDRGETFYGSCTEEGGGWKIHISAAPVSAEKIVNSVIPYITHHNISAKIVTTMSLMRGFYAASRYEEENAVSQVGKFVVVYTGSIKNAVKIIGDFDQMFNNIEYRDGDFIIPAPADEKKFVRSDFVACTGDFAVHSRYENGISGALFVRYVDSYAGDSVPGLDSAQQRRIPVVSSEAFLTAFPGGCNPFSAWGFTLSYHGVNLPGPTPELVDFLREGYLRMGRAIPRENEIKRRAMRIALEAVGFLLAVEETPSFNEVFGNSPAALLPKTVRLRVPLP